MKEKSERENKSTVILIIYSICMSLICVGSSPILDYMDPDSQNFWLIGRALAAGQTAYVDIFDHKGPYIFFINELAALISPYKEVGLFFVECLEYSVSSIIVYNISRKYSEKESASVLSVMAFIGVMFNFFTFVTGNLTDSHSVVFQLISVYLIVKYSDSDKIEHPPVYMFIHGVVATIVLMMRPNNAGMWIPFGIVLAHRLLSNKQIKNFIINLFSLFGGVLVGCIPYIYYGVKHDCFPEMWEGMFTYNFVYTSNNASVSRFLPFIKKFIFQPAFIIVILGVISTVIILKYVKSSYLKITFVSMFICSLFFMNVSMRSDGQYYQLYMIFSIPFMIAFFNKYGGEKNKYIWVGIIIFMTIISNLQLIKQITKYGAFHYFYEAGEEMKTIIDDEPSDKVIVTGCNSVFYNVTETLPHIKYFITYGGGLDYNNFPDATLMQYNSIVSCENDYVIVCYDEKGSIYNIKELDFDIVRCLKNNYEKIYEVEEKHHIALYKKIDKK